MYVGGQGLILLSDLLPELFVSSRPKKIFFNTFIQPFQQSPIDSAFGGDAPNDRNSGDGSDKGNGGDTVNRSRKK
jgi:hypothetical protein